MPPRFCNTSRLARIPRKTYDTQLYGVAHNPELALSSGRALGGLEGPRPSPADMWLKQVHLPRMRASHPARRIVTPLSAPEQAA